MSRYTIGRGIEDLFENVLITLKSESKDFVLYSIAMDGSADATDTAQLYTFFRGADKDFHIVEEQAAFFPMRDTTMVSDCTKV